MPHWPQMIGPKPIDLKLHRVIALLEALGNPHLNLPPVVHVAGTNGKGSTLAFLQHILQAAGYKVHLYTSPHLREFNERIVVAGSKISDTELYQTMEECRIASQKHDIPVTFFEGTTVGAFLAFSRHKADIVLLETGLGGRLDATNVIPNPLLTIITPISLDHTEYLGSTITAIAGEKAGIIKAGVPCVTSLQTDETDAVLEEKAQKVMAPLIAFGYDWHSEPTETGMHFHLKSTDDNLDLPLPSLAGEHQIINAGTAICAAKHLSGFDISDEHIKQGITATTWPARLEHINKGELVKRLPNNQWSIWVDGAHNQAAAHTLASTLTHNNNTPLYLAIGMTKGRDIKAFIQHFKHASPHITGMLITTEPSAYAPAVIADAANDLGFETFEADHPDDAIDYITTTYADRPGRILFTGSLYLTTDVYKSNTL